MESSGESTGEGGCSERDTKGNSDSAEEDEGLVDADCRGGGAGFRRRRSSGRARRRSTRGLRLSRSGGGHARRGIFDALWCEKGSSQSVVLCNDFGVRRVGNKSKTSTYESLADEVGIFDCSVDVRLRWAGTGDAVENALDKFFAFAEACVVGLAAAAGGDIAGLQAFSRTRCE